MPEQIIVVPNLFPFFIELLKQSYVVHDLTGRSGPAEIPGLDPKAVRVAVSRGEAKFPAALMDELPALELIANFGVGYDGIDSDAAIERGIAVTNTPDVLTDETANLCLALTLALTRRIVEADRFVRAGDWKRKGEFGMSSSIIGKTAGIVGLGRIGLAVARLLEACGARIIYHDVAARKDLSYPYFADLVALARASDLVVNTCVGGEATRGLISAAVIDAMKPDAFLISSSRGSVVDEQALVKALVERRIAGAGLDVFADEPNVPEPLLAMDNVVLLPHTGSRTRETWRAMADLCMANMERYYREEPLLTPVPGASERPRRVR
jgi:lactate dehydrogenase-like 2-hydroxyacid dehydrogenase